MICNSSIYKDPIYNNENLCSTMQTTSSTDYFQTILKNSLEYFCQIPPVNSIHEDKSKGYDRKIIDALHDSYELFTQCLFSTIKSDPNINQGKVRVLYVELMNKKRTPLPKPQLELEGNNWLLWLDKSAKEDNTKDVFQPYFNNNLVVSNDILLESDETNQNNVNDENLKVAIDLSVDTNYTDKQEPDQRLVVHWMYYLV